MSCWRSFVSGSIGLALLLPSVPRALNAQQQSQPPAPIERRDGQTPTIHVESRLVNVALNVVDETGAPVGGLTRDDFQIAEDGKPQKIAIFDRESTTPLEIVIAVDASGSVLGDEPLELKAAKKFVQTILRPQDAIDVMEFADDVTELTPFTNDEHRIDSALGHISPGDATALYDAIYLASQRLGETPSKEGQRRVVVLITDGENTTRHGDYDSALEQAERAGAMIYSLIIVPIEADAGRNTGGEHALIQMARDTGGKYYYVNDRHDLAPAFAHVSDDLRTQYTLGYYAPQRGGDEDGLRHIQIQLKDPALRAKYKLRYRTAYYGNR
ncbi:MAG TPA: VWA domain-containing protein [Candidatus Aquilonibacter sp.]|nr:VWA domain-containing protein [Candidatus Aquilonibacter sp.]